MSDDRLEALERRVAEIERRLAAKGRTFLAFPDWRSVACLAEETEFSRAMESEMSASRDADRCSGDDGPR